MPSDISTRANRYDRRQLESKKRKQRNMLAMALRDGAFHQRIVKPAKGRGGASNLLKRVGVEDE